MTSEIQPGSSNPAEYSVPEFKDNSGSIVDTEQEARLLSESEEPLPDWKIKEREDLARRDLAQLELEKAVEFQDIKIFEAIYSQRKGEIHPGLLVPVYAKAVHQMPITFVRELENFLWKQDKNLLEAMLETMEDSKARETLNDSFACKLVGDHS